MTDSYAPADTDIDINVANGEAYCINDNGEQRVEVDCETVVDDVGDVGFLGAELLGNIHRHSAGEELRGRKIESIV